MSANKLVKQFGISQRNAERLHKRLAEDRSDLSLIVSTAVALYLDYRDCDEYPHHKR
jgi:hypothetical protein